MERETGLEPATSSLGSWAPAEVRCRIFGYLVNSLSHPRAPRRREPDAILGNAKDLDASAHLTPGWQQRVHEKFHGAFPEPALLLYINHLAWELDKTAARFAPAA